MNCPSVDLLSHSIVSVLIVRYTASYPVCSMSTLCETKMNYVDFSIEPHVASAEAVQLFSKPCP